nr:MAG TPA: hypothetical protein [Caudoviricetes sp.]
MFEIYVKNKNSKYWELAIEISNELEGLPVLWMFLEKKYLPSYTPVDKNGKPCDWEWVKDHVKKGEYVSRYSAFQCQEILDLQRDYRLTYEEMMVFRTTLDNAAVLGEDIPAFLGCLKVVANECGGIFPQQHKALSDYVKTHSIDDIKAIAFNQTSVISASDTFGEDMDAPLSEFWDLMWSKDRYSKRQKKYFEQYEKDNKI